MSSDEGDSPTSVEPSWTPTHGSGEAMELELAEPGTRVEGRFVVQELLGAGAHGAVYEVHDELRGSRLALKTLLRMSPDELVRFKHEFRLVSDLSHPNLVTVHELFVRGERAWLTMELCPGTDFLSWVREDDVLDEARLRDALLQLARGLAALHGAGILHRDLKPSNVLVRPDGHVLVADFGLARALDREHGEGIAGTPAYMSPEQAADLELTPASDWYGVGVMLHEALTGLRPHAELSGIGLLMAKQLGDVAPPSELQPGLPADLDRLCAELLARDPAARPTGADVLRRLGAANPGAAVLVHGSAEVFVGRAAELARLERALELLRSTGRARAIVVEGRSGSGKTALVRRWLQRASEAGAIMLGGRCYERESVPYKGLDELVDSLRALLHARGGTAAIAGAGALGRLFPVLRDVRGIGDAPLPRDDDPFESRRQAVDALRELLDRIARAATLVLVIDDLQWCDDDSAGLLLELLRSRHRPRALFVALVRTDDTPSDGPLARVAHGLEQLGAELETERLPIGPLPPADAIAVARALLPARSDREAIAAAIAGDCEGNPMLVAELARHVAAAPSQTGARSLQLDEVIRARAARLPEDARAVLEIVAIAARPTALRVVVEAAHARERELEAIALLRGQAFVRTHAELDRIEPYHDRIAAGVRATMSPERIVECHLALAHALERGAGEPEEIAFHFEAAHVPERALEHVTRAAERADLALALHRAAQLYRMALALLREGDPRRGPLQRALGDTLARDGRGALAAEAYQAAAATARGTLAIELRRAAAEQLLRSGRLREGLAALRVVLDAVGLRMPSGSRTTMVALLAARAQIRVRGLEFVERTEAEIDPKLLLEIDTTWAAATGLLQSSVLLGQYFQARHLLLALQGGEPRRIARALGLETLYAATSGTRGLAHCDALLERVIGLCRRIDDARARGIAELATGIADVYRGRFPNAYPRLVEAERMLRESGTVAQWELAMARTFATMSLFYTGELRRMQELLATSVRDATEHDDRYGQLMLRVSYEPVCMLFDDRTSDARRVLAELRRAWPAELDTPTYHYVLAMTASRIERYSGGGARALAAIEEQWNPIERSLMLTKQPLMIFMAHERGCAALHAAFAERGAARRRASIIARDDSDRLLRERTPWSRAMAGPLVAALHAAAGERDAALQAAIAAERSFVEQAMPVFAAAMVRRRGELLGGSDGAASIARADAVLREHGAAAPAAMTSLLTPPLVGW